MPQVAGAYAGRSVPSHYADAREVRMLADVCRDRDAVFQVTPNPRNPLSFLLILSLAVGLFRPPLRATVLSALDMSDYPHLWRLFPLTTFVVNRLLGGNLRFQTLTGCSRLRGGAVTPLFEGSTRAELNRARLASTHPTMGDPEFRRRLSNGLAAREYERFRDPRACTGARPGPALAARRLRNRAQRGRRASTRCRVARSYTSTALGVIDVTKRCLRSNDGAS